MKGMRLQDIEFSRETEIFTARVCLASASRHRDDPGFHALMLEFAAKHRRRAMAGPRQSDMFAEIAA